jgi:hypothetical protein
MKMYPRRGCGADWLGWMECEILGPLWSGDSHHSTVESDDGAVESNWSSRSGSNPRITSRVSPLITIRAGVVEVS